MSGDHYRRFRQAQNEYERELALGGEPSSWPSRSANVAASYRLFVNEERTILVTIWNSGAATIAVRESPGHTWGPPVTLNEEMPS